MVLGEGKPMRRVHYAYRRRDGITVTCARRGGKAANSPRRKTTDLPVEQPSKFDLIII